MISFLLLGCTLVSLILPLMVFFIDTLPALILHFQYLSKNASSSLIFRREKNQIEYKKKDYTLNYSFEEIQQITNVSSSLKTYFSGKYSFANYFYYKLKFKDGVELVITCLLADDLDGLFSLIFDKRIDINKKTFPSI
ncbi:MAG TPA: hypothetical protein VMT76_17185 [Puia sp.]|nr:hypothetical protein [Puia sp.]